MQKSILLSAAKLASAVSVFVYASTALAAPITLTLEELSLQQTLNTPCVIGDPSCNNPAGFDFTTIPANDSADSLTSPTYTVGQIRDLVGGNAFSVGIDINEPDTSYTLDSFTLSIDGTVEFTFGPSVLTVVNDHGNGFSDFALTGFDLTPFAADSSAVFGLTYTDAQGGREQYFTLAGTPSPTEVPEPASLLLMGTALAGGLIKRRLFAA